MTAKKGSGTEGARAKASGGAAEDALSFEEALARLEAIVAGLEDGETPLEASVKAYAEGMRLVARCLRRLEEAEATVKTLTEAAGAWKLAPLEGRGELAEDEDDAADA